MKISVVTVCYNAENEIEATMLSVFHQSYKNIEYIVIDGASKDNTLDKIKEIARKFPGFALKIMSEPDKGIYDAMNKGIGEATGDWTIFLNAGDCFFDSGSLQRIVEKIKVDAEIVYGMVVYSYRYGKYIMRPAPLETIKSSMPFGHPATLVITSLLKKYRFDTRYKIAADYDLFYRLYTDGHNFQFVGSIVTEFDAQGGVSNQRWIETRRETCFANKTYGSFRYWTSFIKMCIIMYTKDIAYKLFPKPMIRWDISSKNHQSQYISLEEYEKQQA